MLLQDLIDSLEHWDKVGSSVGSHLLNSALVLIEGILLNLLDCVIIEESDELLKHAFFIYLLSKGGDSTLQSLEWLARHGAALVQAEDQDPALLLHPFRLLRFLLLHLHLELGIDVVVLDRNVFQMQQVLVCFHLIVDFYDNRI